MFVACNSGCTASKSGLEPIGPIIMKTKSVLQYYTRGTLYFQFLTFGYSPQGEIIVQQPTVQLHGMVSQ